MKKYFILSLLLLICNSLLSGPRRGYHDGRGYYGGRRGYYPYRRRGWVNPYWNYGPGYYYPGVGFGIGGPAGGFYFNIPID